MTDDDARWAEAQSILDGIPTESAAELLRRARRIRWMVTAGSVAVCLALGLLVAALFLDPSEKSSEPDIPPWREATGFAVLAVGFVLGVVTFVMQIRTNRRVRVWNSPLTPLRLPQREHLLRQARGQIPVVPERVPLARHFAGLVALQRASQLLIAGLLVMDVGQWLVSGKVYWLILTGCLLVVALVGGALAMRDDRRVRRFLAEHPVSDA